MNSFNYMELYKCAKIYVKLDDWRFWGRAGVEILGRIQNLYAPPGGPRIAARQHIRCRLKS